MLLFSFITNNEFTNRRARSFDPKLMCCYNLITFDTNINSTQYSTQNNVMLLGKNHFSVAKLTLGRKIGSIRFLEAHNIFDV